jgi:translation initiation factor IF-3
MTAEHASLAVAAGVIEALETADAQVLDLVEVAEHLCAA